jgi:hypothetical protein
LLAAPDFVLVSAEGLCDTLRRAFFIGGITLAAVAGILSVKHARGVEVSLLYWSGHLAPVTEFKVYDTLGAVVIGRYLAPEMFILRQSQGALSRSWGANWTMRGRKQAK